MGTKRKAPAVDFQKTRKKLGKGKQLNSNATDTSFKAKTIALPQQSISVDRSHALTTKRNQTLDDLVVQTRHHSPGVRRDAVLGFLELVTTYPALLLTERQLLGGVLGLIGDDDVGVRATVIKYLRHVVRALSAEQLAPHLSPLLLYTTSALSHIMNPVRLDALLVLQLLLEQAPAAATAGWEGALDAGGSDTHGQRVLQALLVLLGVGADAKGGRASARSAVSIDMRSGDRLRVLRTLDAFLQAALHSQDAPSWYLGAAFSSPSDWERFVAVFDEPPAGARGELWADRSLLREGVARYAAASTPSVRDAICAAVAPAPRESGSTARLATILHAPLLAALLDAVTDLAGENAEVVAAILSVYVNVWRCAVSRHASARAQLGAAAPLDKRGLAQVLAHLAPHLPTDALSGSVAVRINASYCELVALAVAGEQVSGRLAVSMDQTLWYLVGLLRDGALSGEMFGALVPTIWLLLIANVALEEQAALLGALLQYCGTLPSRSPAQLPAYGMVARLCLLHTYPSLRLEVPALESVHAELQAWLLSMPKKLWESAAFAAARAEADDERAFVWSMLVFLHRTAVQADGVCFSSDTLAALQPRLQPLLEMRHPKKGVVPGPCARMPATGNIARAVLAYLTND